MKRLLMLLPLFLAGSPALAFWGNEEPWATPKGDARTDCAVYKLKNKRHDVLQTQEKKATSYALEKYRAMLSTNTKEEVDEWWFSDDNPYHEIAKKEDEAYAEIQLAQLNVAKHLGYSKQRLREMWEWRVTNGEKFKKYFREEGGVDLFNEKTIVVGEVADFCKNFF